MIETPQWLSLAVRRTSSPLPRLARTRLSNLSSCFFLIYYTLLQWPLFVARSQKTWFHYHRAFVPATPTAQVASVPVLPPFYHFHRCIILIICSLGQISLFSAIFILLFVLFHLLTCKMIIFISLFTALFFSLDVSSRKAYLSCLLPQAYSLSFWNVVGFQGTFIG